MPEYRWNVSAFAEGYDAAAPEIHPYYVAIQDYLIDLLARESEADACVLDLGGGSGRLVERILEEFPQSTAIVLDQSEAFLGLAERRLVRFSDRITFVQSRLQDRWIEELKRQPNAIVSMSAIHHLDPSEKAQLYLQAFDALDVHGTFMNGDEIRDADDHVYLTHLQNWSLHMEHVMSSGLAPEAMHPALQGWIERNVKNFGQPKVSGDDCHETVATQLQYLRDVGFSTVDAPWERDLWAVFVARKNG